jgi:hypothetical protein
MTIGRGFVALLAMVVGWGWMATAAQEATPAAGVTAAALTRTNVRYFLPFGPSGLNPALKVTDRADGTCDSGSSVLPGRPDAWFCMEAAGGVLDPCIENIWTPEGQPTQLACASDPFRGDVVLLTATAPLPETQGAAPGTGAPTLPWALELANGERCGLIRGATTGFAGMRLNYGCEGGGSVIGDVDRSSPVWAVSYLADGGWATDLVEVAVAWQ